MKLKKFCISVISPALFLITFTCFAQKDFTPDWSKGVVWYQIFPERFYNGDLKNDPKVKAATIARYAKLLGLKGDANDPSTTALD